VTNCGARSYFCAACYYSVYWGHVQLPIFNGLGAAFCMAGEKNLIGDEIGGLQELSNPSNYRFVFIESGNWNNGGDTLARFLMASSDTCMVCTSLRNWYHRPPPCINVRCIFCI
jgi:hypothetical protein